MRRLLIPIVSLMLSALIAAAVPTEQDAAIYENTVRLHILAPSDSSEDQSLKLKVRDAVLENFSATLQGDDADEAKEKLTASLSKIEHLANEIANENGYEADAKVVSEWYDTRTYGSITLPCGTYTSLRITIGEGLGQNWWCVMYPPLCLDIATAEREAVKENDLLSQSGYCVRFKLLEVAAILTSKEK